MDIVDAKIAASQEHEVWKWLQKVVMELGHDGMSSDESAVESDVGAVFHVRKLPWRRDITKELDMIDSARFDPLKNFGKGGMKPIIRRRKGDVVSERDPVVGLPRTFYDEGWIKGENDKLELNIS